MIWRRPMSDPIEHAAHHQLRLNTRNTGYPSAISCNRTTLKDGDSSLSSFLTTSFTIWRMCYGRARHTSTLMNSLHEECLSMEPWQSTLSCRKDNAFTEVVCLDRIQRENCPSTLFLWIWNNRRWYVPPHAANSCNFNLQVSSTDLTFRYQYQHVI